MLNTSADLSSAKFNAEASLLEQVSSQCEHVSRFHGVSQLEGKACLVMKLYSKSLQDELDTTAGDI